MSTMGTHRDVSWGANCDVCDTRLNAGRARECLGADGSVVCGSCRDEERAAEVRAALRDLVEWIEGFEDYERPGFRRVPFTPHNPELARAKKALQ